MEKINLPQAFNSFSEHWSPRIAGELNENHVKLVKILGDFIWHQHENEDELFLVVSGRFRMDFRDKQVWIESGEMIIVPKGVEHKPYAEEECHILLVEPKTTRNTGEIVNERTIEPKIL